MSQATDAMAAAITNLQNKIAAGGGVTAAEVSTQIAAAVTPLTTQIQTILAGQGTSDSKIADIQAELAESLPDGECPPSRTSLTFLQNTCDPCCRDKEFLRSWSLLLTSVALLRSYSAKSQRFSVWRLGCWVRGLCLGALAATRRGRVVDWRARMVIVGCCARCAWCSLC